MERRTPSNGSVSFWTTMPGVVTAVAGLVTAIAALVGALAATGIFEPDDPPTPTTVAQTSTTVAPPAPSSPKPSAQPASQRPVANLASIDLVYPGDSLGCMLQLIVQVGGQTAQPTGSRFTIRNVRTGKQQYAIRGSISCTAAGFCSATGSGVVDVADGNSYFVTWLNTAVGACDVTLRE